MILLSHHFRLHYFSDVVIVFCLSKKQFCCIKKPNNHVSKKIYLALLLLAAFGFMLYAKSSASENPVSNQSNETVLYWNEVAYNAFGGPQYQHSLMASRINATMHLAIHDALNGIEENTAVMLLTEKMRRPTR